MKSKDCCVCLAKNLSKNTIGINKKLLGEGITNFFCINCLADHLDCDVQDILDKIEEFKADGCILFERIRCLEDQYTRIMRPLPT